MPDLLRIFSILIFEHKSQFTKHVYLLQGLHELIIYLLNLYDMFVINTLHDT